MKIFNTKLYVLEEMTQEDLNNLALERNTLAEENKRLKQQLDYLRSGEYYNQLRFENEMLQKIVDTNGVPSEVYDYIDCVHRNTELLGKRQKLIDYLKEQIKLCKKAQQLALKSKNIEQVGFLNLRIAIYQEILSKIESGEK